MSKASYHAHKAEGLCLQCGMPLDVPPQTANLFTPVLLGERVCRLCRNRHRASQRQRRNGRANRRMEAKEWTELGTWLAHCGQWHAVERLPFPAPCCGTVFFSEGASRMHPYDTPAARALLGTMSDQAVATQLGIGRVEVTRWRRSLDIPPWYPIPHRPSTAARQAILARLQRHPEGLTSLELRLLDGISRQAVYETLHRMEVRGLVRAVRSPHKGQAMRWFALHREGGHDCHG